MSSIRALIDPSLELNKAAEEKLKTVVSAGLTGLEAVNQANIAVNKFVTPRRTLGVVGKAIDALPGDQSKFLDTSYHDVRQRVVDYARSHHEGWGIAADVLAPDAIDFVGGIGYWDNIARGIGKVRKFAPEIGRGARNLSRILDDALTPNFLKLQVAAAGGAVLDPSNVRKIIGTDDALAATAMKHVTDVRRTTLATRGSKHVRSTSTLPPEDQIIKETFPRLKSKHDQSLVKALSGDNLTGPAKELRDIVLQQNKALEHAPTLKLPNGREVKVTRLNRKGAQDLANQISDLKKQLGLSAPSKYDQITGYYVEGTTLFRLDSKGKLKKVQDNVDRNILEKLWPADESLLTARQAQTAAREKHHFRILEPSKIFAQVRDKAGNWVKRSQKQIDNVTARLQKDGVFIGNQDLNEVFQTKAAHIGAGGNRYGSHAQLRTLTDVQGRTLADADFLKVVNKTDGKPVWVKQVKNKQGVVTDFVTENGDKIKPSHIGETLEYKVHGRTYDPKAMHGFSKEGIEYISKIKGDDELYDAMKLYYEINDEAYKGVAGLASKLVDAGVQVDDLTKTLVKEFSPETQNWINHLLTLPEYKKDTRLLQALIRNSEDLLTLPGYKNKPKLKTLVKRIQTGLDTQTGLKQKLKIN